MLLLAHDGPAASCTHADVMIDAMEELIAAGVRLDGPLEFKKAATSISRSMNGRSSAGATSRLLPRKLG